MCDACGKHHQGLFYQCITCFLSFIYEDCVFSPKRLLIQEGTSDEFFHTHPLILTYGFPIADQQAKFNPRCRVYNKSFSGYEDFWVYKCEKCRYYAHHHCAYSRSSYLRTLNLKLPSKKQVPLSNRLDPRQAPRPITIEELEDDHDVLRLPLSEQNYNKVRDFFFKERNYESSITDHNIHEHPLILVDAQCNDITTMTWNDARCNACLIPIEKKMTFYKCKFNGQGCNFVLHEWCTRLPPEIKGHKYYTGHEYLQEHTLLLSPKPAREFIGFMCGVCRRHSNGFVYLCVQCEYYEIDVWCAFTRAKIIHKSHPNHLLSRNYGFASEDDYCRMCLSGFTADGNISFGCDACEFHLHAGCAFLLTETIRHRYDKHPLSLAYSPVENR
ncbi:hypothetical protein Hdeb2414_s0025g00666991 [Helianthus debilis subsp. tardiflorus]